MLRTSPILASVALLLTIALVVASLLARGGAPPASPQEWQATGLTAPPGDFNIDFRLEGDTQGTVRLILGLRGEETAQSYVFAEFRAPAHVLLGEVRGGREHVIAAGKAEGSLLGKALTLRRRGERVDVIGEGAMLLGAYLPAPADGRIALAARGGLRVAAPRVQPIEPVYFADDFMRVPEEKSEWQIIAGEWQVSGKPNPLRSANPFNYFGRGAPRAAAVIGRTFWSDYRFAVACGTGDADAVGIYFCYRDEENYHLFRWARRGRPDAALEWIECRHGERRVLARQAGGFLPDQWYTLWAEVRDGAGRVGIDDITSFDLTMWDVPSTLTQGKVGLHVEGEKGAEFDDVLVRPTRNVYDGLSHSYHSQWLPVQGMGTFLPGPPHGQKVPWICRLRDATILLRGFSSRDYRVHAEVAVRSGMAGLVFCHRDAGNYLALEVEWPRVRLVRVAEGKREILATGEGDSTSDDALLNLTASVRGGRVEAACGRMPPLRAADPAYTGGRVGLLAAGQGPADFLRFVAETLEPLPLLASTQETFAHEKTMTIWAGALSDWSFRPLWAPSGTREHTWWHRADFRGDLRLELKLPALLKASRNLALYAAAAEDNPREGYALRLEMPDAAGSASGRLSLWRRAEMIAEQSVRADVAHQTLALRRLQDGIFGELDGEVILRYRDDAPLKGTHLGWGLLKTTADAGKDQPEKPEVAEAPQIPIIATDNVRNYTFAEAPVDWRVAAGTWEVTSRWECDPRWSFFSGRGERLAAIWNKRSLHGDVTLDFYVGPKMESARGKKYEYVSDMNVVLCGDGQHLTSGYSFIFGGKNNTVTRICRQGLVVAETPNVRIEASGGIHRRWYHIRAEKRGGRVSLWIDGQEVLRYDDPRPLGDGQAAIWTYNNAIMVARVSLAAEAIGTRESPLVAAPEVCKSVYEP